jgi:hypothetical protein
MVHALTWCEGFQSRLALRRSANFFDCKKVLKLHYYIRLKNSSGDVYITWHWSFYHAPLKNVGACVLWVLVQRFKADA